jgi:hypothetical protein
MTPNELIEAARAAGVTLRTRIWADNADALRPEIRAAIRADEAEIVRHLVDPFIIVLCARCGGSQRFVAIENPEGWTCSICSPDWKMENVERVAIQTETDFSLETPKAA